MIQSVYIGDDANLIQILLDLHSRGPGTKILDATFGHGGFWRGTESLTAGREIIGLDMRMATGELTTLAGSRGFERTLVAGDYHNLPFGRNTFDVVLFDPPFLTGGGENQRMKKWYTTFDSYEDLMISLQRARDEFARVLKPKGFVIMKSMDWTEGSRRRWMHIDAVNLWAGPFRLDDLIVKVAAQNMRNPGWKRQERSRAAHVYFLVFRPANKSRDGHGKKVAGDVVENSRVPALATNGHGRDLQGALL